MRPNKAIGLQDTESANRLWRDPSGRVVPPHALKPPRIEGRLGQKIARLQRAAGHTQAELAARVGLQPEFCRLHDKDAPKFYALDRLVWFGSQLTALEVELVMAVGSTALTLTENASRAFMPSCPNL